MSWAKQPCSMTLKLSSVWIVVKLGLFPFDDNLNSTPTTCVSETKDNVFSIPNTIMIIEPPLI